MPAVRSNPVENRAERYLTIEGVDYCLDVRREVWIGFAPGRAGLLPAWRHHPMTMSHDMVQSSS
jgi:hypothetical protein